MGSPRLTTVIPGARPEALSPKSRHRLVWFLTLGFRVRCFASPRNDSDPILYRAELYDVEIRHGIVGELGYQLQLPVDIALHRRGRVVGAFIGALVDIVRRRDERGVIALQ